MLGKQSGGISKQDLGAGGGEGVQQKKEKKKIVAPGGNFFFAGPTPPTPWAKGQKATSLLKP